MSRLSLRCNLTGNAERLKHENSASVEPVLRLSVTAASHRYRLDDYIAERVPELSRMRLHRLIEEGAGIVNGVSRPPGYRLAKGDSVSFCADLDAPTSMKPERIPIDILFEDEWLAVVDKPAGMVVHPCGHHRDGTLANALAYHWNVANKSGEVVRPGIVHRLDRSTSGLIVVARTQEALSRITISFQKKQVEKRYIGLVHGSPKPPNGEWRAPIGNDPNANPRWGVRPEGRPGHTRYETIDRFAEYSLIRMEPVTGRTNQLRLHSAHFGCPIAGDDLFGRGYLRGLERLFLHAHRLKFRHPENNDWMEFESALPPELRTFLDALEPAEA